MATEKSIRAVAWVGTVSVVGGLDSRGAAGLLALLAALLLLGQRIVNLGDHSTTGKRDVLEKSTQIGIVAHGDADGAGSDALALLHGGVLGGELEQLGSEVLNDGRQVHSAAACNALGVAPAAQHGRDAANGEDQSSASTAALSAAALLGYRSALALWCGTSHVMILLSVRNSNDDPKPLHRKQDSMKRSGGKRAEKVGRLKFSCWRSSIRLLVKREKIKK